MKSVFDSNNSITVPECFNVTIINSIRNTDQITYETMSSMQVQVNYVHVKPMRKHNIYFRCY